MCNVFDKKNFNEKSIKFTNNSILYTILLLINKYV